MYSLWAYMRKINVNYRREQVKILMLGETFFWESVSQNSCSGKETAQIELSSPME